MIALNKSLMYRLNQFYNRLIRTFYESAVYFLFAYIELNK